MLYQNTPTGELIHVFRYVGAKSKFVAIYVLANCLVLYFGLVWFK